MSRPENTQKKITVEIQATPKLLAYLEDLRKIEGYGETRQEIVKGLVWDAINLLLRDKQLKRR